MPLHVAKGDRVVVWLQNCPQYVIACYAAWRIGAVVVPLSPMLTSTEIGFFFRDSGARVAVVDAEFLPRLGGYAPGELTDHAVVVDSSPDAQLPPSASRWEDADAALRLTLSPAVSMTTRCCPTRLVQPVCLGDAS